MDEEPFERDNPSPPPFAFPPPPLLYTPQNTNVARSILNRELQRKPARRRVHVPGMEPLFGIPESVLKNRERESDGKMSLVLKLHALFESFEQLFCVPHHQIQNMLDSAKYKLYEMYVKTVECVRELLMKITEEWKEAKAALTNEFVQNGGIQVIVNFLFRTLPPSLGGVNPNTSYMLQQGSLISLTDPVSATGGCFCVWEDCLLLVRELCLFSHSAMIEWSENDHFICALFKMMTSRCLFPLAVGLCEELLHGRNGDFPLRKVDCLDELLETMTCTQLALFCKMVSLLVYGYQEREFLLKEGYTPEEFLIFRRNTVTPTLVDENQDILLSSPVFLARLVHMLRKLTYLPDSVDCVYSDENLRTMRSYTRFEWLFIVDQELAMKWDVMEIREILERMGPNVVLRDHHKNRDGIPSSDRDGIPASDRDVSAAAPKNPAADIVVTSHSDDSSDVDSDDNLYGNCSSRFSAASTTPSMTSLLRSCGELTSSTSNTPSDTLAPSTVTPPSEQQPTRPRRTPLKTGEIVRWFLESKDRRPKSFGSDTLGSAYFHPRSPFQTSIFQDTLMSNFARSIDIGLSEEHPELDGFLKHMRDTMLVMNQIEVVLVLCVLTNHKRKTYVQDTLMGLGIVDVLNTIFDKLNWDTVLKGDLFPEKHHHNESCECSVGSTLKMQYLRLIHNLFDRDSDNSHNKRMFLTNTESKGLEPLPHLYDSMCVEHRMKDETHGMFHKLIDVLLQIRSEQVYPFWIATAVASFLRGKNAALKRLACDFGIVDHVINSILGSPFQSSNMLQPKFDLLGECVAWCPFNLLYINDQFSPEQLSELLRIAYDNILDSNVFLRALVLTLAQQREVDETSYPFETCTFSRWLNENRQRVLYKVQHEVHVENVTQENVCCINTSLVLLIFAKRENKLEACLDSLRKEDELRMIQDELSTNVELKSTQNLRQLIHFWEQYYLFRPREISNLIHSSNVPMADWFDIVSMLAKDSPKEPNSLVQDINEVPLPVFDLW